MRRAVLLPLALVVLGPWSEAGASAPPPLVDVVKVEGALDAPLTGYVEAALAEAEADGAVLVLQLDSPGALDQPGLELARRVFEARVPVVVWVGPTPARASGAALLLMHASSLAAVAPGSQTGPLHPVDLARPGAEEAGVEETIAGWVEARGKGTDLTGPDVALTAAQALERRFAQAVAVSVTELLRKIDGTTVQTAAGPVTLATRIATVPSEAPGVRVRFRDLGLLTQVLHAVATPSAVYLLLTLALAALAFELTQPGFGFAGASGVVMLGLAGYGLAVVPVSWAGLALLLAGVGLMVLDVLLRRLGAFTGAGLLAYLAGSVLAFRGVAEPLDLPPWLIGLAVAGSLLYYGFGLTVALQARERLTSRGRGLVGLVGEARGDLAPEGPVEVKGALWRGRSADGPIPKGTRVRVRGVDGLILRVEPEAGGGDPPPARG